MSGLDLEKSIFLNQNKAFINFSKRGQCMIAGHIIVDLY